MKKEVNTDILKQNINDWVYKFIGPSFQFREYQFEQIYNICLNILEDVHHTQVIEAPTGSGKSLLNIISAGVLAEYYERTSYILCSDLYLWKQYEDFVNQHRAIKKEFGIIKGQTGNYVCSKNDQDMRNAECRMAGLSWANMFNYDKAEECGFGCAKTCKYVKERKKAVRAKVVIMTYQLFHFMINVVSQMNIDKKCCFEERDVIFCDECHNIPSIVQNCFKPEIKLSDFYFFENLHHYLGNTQLEIEFPEDEDKLNDKLAEEPVRKILHDLITLEDLKAKYNKMWEVLIDKNISRQDIDWALNEYMEMLDMCLDTVDLIESNLRIKRQVLHQKFTADDVKLYKVCSWFRNTCCVWNDLAECVRVTGIEYVLRLIEESRLLKETVVSLPDVKEDYMCWYFLLRKCKNHVMMSATVGGFDAFAENVGFHYLEQNFTNPDEEIQFNVIPSTFDFEKSPVHFLNRYKMSYKEKDNSLRVLKPMIYKILGGQFKNERGMIQTGSYANAELIYNDAPPEIKSRMLLYNNSRDKIEKITIHQMSQNTILIGPTLVEGIDLPGDQCRFIIIMKVPYPVIVDDYVKRKIELFPKWYNSTTSNTIIQGIGRGNRYKEDYCVTYIFDACFLPLYTMTKDQYPKELQERIKIYN